MIHNQKSPIALAVLICIMAAACWRGSGTRTQSTNAAPHYTGAAVCGSCHASERAAWQGSDHQLAMANADSTHVLGDFNAASFTYAGTTSTFSQHDGKYFVHTDGPDGQLHDYEIAYTFGTRPLQQYLVNFPGGRKQALSIAWDSRAKDRGGQRWFHLYPDQNVKAGDWLHWTNPSQNWNFMCAECHSTDLRKNYEPSSNSYKTTWSELNVACEACHGPGSDHVAWARKAGDWRRFDVDKGLAIALDERRGVTWRPVPESGNARRSAPRLSTREIDSCASCHARASHLNSEHVRNQSPLADYRLGRLDEENYWPDGQMRGEVYNWSSFVQSKMYAHGVTCSDCHEPHSLQLRAPGNKVCAQCHQPAKFDTAAHTHHASSSPAGACAACHMPTSTYMEVDVRHDHSLRIPRPDQSSKLGTPNACNACHTHESAQWAAAAVSRWTGRPPSGFQRFAEAFHASSMGAAGADAALLTVIDDAAQPALVRASAIDRLADMRTPDTVRAASRALHEPDPSLRLAATEALARAPTDVLERELPALLTDAVLAVRIEAARALAGASEHVLTAEQRSSFDAALAEYIAVQTHVADRPEGQVKLGTLAAVRGDASAAIASFQQALQLDPMFVAAYANLADLYRALGDEHQAEATLRRGLASDPRSAALHYALGLALTRQRARAQSLEEFRAAAQLAPNDARLARVYSMALEAAGPNEH